MAAHFSGVFLAAHSCTQAHFKPTISFAPRLTLCIAALPAKRVCFMCNISVPASWTGMSSLEVSAPHLSLSPYAGQACKTPTQHTSPLSNLCFSWSVFNIHSCICLFIQSFSSVLFLYFSSFFKDT